MATADSKASTSSPAKGGFGQTGMLYDSLLQPIRRHKFDRGWSWMVDFGVFMSSFFIIGWFRCFGLIFISIQESYQVTKLETSLVGTANIICFNLLAPLGSLLAERYTNRCVVITGGLVMALGLGAGFFVHSLHGYILTIGVLHGIGTALAFLPSVVMLGTYFRKRLGLATGIAFAGSSCSQLIMPLLMAKLIDAFSLQGALLVMAGLALNICVSGAMFFPVDIAAVMAADDEILRQLALDDIKKQRKENPIVRKDTTVNQPSIVEEHDTAFSGHPLMITPDQESVDTSRYKKEQRRQDATSHRKTSRTLQLPARLRRYSVRRMSHGLTTLRRIEKLNHVLGILKSPLLWTLMIGYGLGTLAFTGGMKYFPPHMAEMGISRAELSMILALCGIPDILSRIGFGLVLDAKIITQKVKRYRLFATSLVVLSCTCFTMAFVQTFAGCLTVFTLFGAGIGMFFTVSSVACFDLMGRDRYRIAYGWMLFMAGIVQIIDSLGFAKLRDVTNNYQASFYLMGSSALLAGVCLFCAAYLVRARKRGGHSNW